MVRSIIFFLLFPPPSIFSFSLSATIHTLLLLFFLCLQLFLHTILLLFLFSGDGGAKSLLELLLTYKVFINGLLLLIIHFYLLIIIGCWERYFCFTSDI